MVGMLLALWFILAQAPGQRLVGVYEGTLPCAGCAGIRTTLALYTGSLAEPRDGTFTLKETVRPESRRGQGTGVARPMDGRPRHGFGPGRHDLPTDRQRCQSAEVLSASGQRHTATARCRTARDCLAGQLHADPHDNAAILGPPLEHPSASETQGSPCLLRGIWLRLSTALNESCSGWNQGSGSC